MIFITTETQRPQRRDIYLHSSSCFMILKIFPFFWMAIFAFSSLKASDCFPPFWIKYEYLLWSIKDQPVPIPLVTTASFADPLPGALHQPGSKVKVGEENISLGWQSGFRISAGSYLNNCLNIGMETDYFLLPKFSHRKTLSTGGLPGDPNFAVPIHDVTGIWGLNGIPGESIFILPGPLDGDPGFKGKFSLHTSSKLQGMEINTIFPVDCQGIEFDLLGGFRWIQLKESLTFAAKTKTVPSFPFEPAFYNTEDRFLTTNNFFGGQLGVRGSCCYQCWSLNGSLKLGAGVMNQRVGIHGFSQTSGGNLFFETKGTSHDILRGGIFAQPTNIGTNHKNIFAAIFDSDIRAGYQISNNIKLFAGYSFLWISHLVRPGNQMDRNINPTFTALADASRDTVGEGFGPIPFGEPEPARPKQGAKKPDFSFKSKNFWAQGLTAGIEFCF